MPWGFEGWRALKHQGVQCLVSDGLVLFSERKINWSGKRNREVHSYEPLYSILSHKQTQIQLLSKKRKGHARTLDDRKRKQKEKQNTFLSRRCVS